MGLVFINYRNSSAGWATVLDECLSEAFGEEQVFRASRSIRPGEIFTGRILESVQKASLFLAVMGPGWLTHPDGSGGRRLDNADDWVRKEIEEALTGGVPVVPILVEDVAMPSYDELPQPIAPLAHHQSLRLHHRNVRYDVARIIEEATRIDPTLTTAEALEASGARPRAAIVPVTVGRRSIVATLAGPAPPRPILTPEIVNTIERIRSGRPWLAGAANASNASELPPDVVPFVGRNDQVADACRRLGSARKRDRPVAALAFYGKPGIGKSALAVHVAHAVSTRLPLDTLYLELGGMSAAPVKPHEAIRALWASLGPDSANLPRDPAERIRRYRRRLAERPVLLVLDDAASVEQVRNLLPGDKRCRVILTSRRPLAGLASCDTVLVDTMTPDDAIALIMRVSGREFPRAEQGELRALVDLLGHLPLALRIAAAILRKRTGWSLPDLTRQLADEHRRLDHLVVDDLDVRAAIALSYRQLPETAQLAFSRLGRFPIETLPLAVAAALFDLDERQTRVVLDGLIDAQLLDEATTNRFRLHSLIRLYAMEAAAGQSDRDWDAAARRAVRRYVNMAAEQGRALDSGDGAAIPLRPGRLPAQAPIIAMPIPGDNSVIQRDASVFLGAGQVLMHSLRQRDGFRPQLRWFEEETDNLCAVQRLAFDLGLHDAVCVLSVSLASILDVHADGTLALSVHELALRSAELLGAKGDDATSTVLVNLARALALTKDKDSARRMLSRALEIRRQLAKSDPVEIARILLRLGHLARESGRLDEADQFYRDSRDLFDSVDYVGGVAGAWSNLALVWKMRGDLDEARGATKAAFELCMSPDNPVTGFKNYSDRAWYIENMGAIIKRQGRQNEAILLHQGSFSIFAELGDLGGAGCALRNLGDCARGRGERELAAELYQASLYIFTTTRNLLGRAQSLLSLARLSASRGRLAQAVRYLAAGTYIYARPALERARPRRAAH